MDAKPQTGQPAQDEDDESEVGVFEAPDDIHEEIADREAEEDHAAGRVVPHAKVRAWLRTWGKPDEKPMPPEWLD